MATETGTLDQPLDLLIVGAGLSGIDLAHHVAQSFPHWSWEIHDVHDDLGGTWHTFTYPGIRSDSDMATFGFPFRPWPHKSTLGQGADIKEYIRDVARDCGALQRLRTDSWIKDADWQTDKNLYAVTSVTGTGERTIYTRRVHYASGYYSHDKGFRPVFPGEQDFTGQIIHPQEWPDDLNVEGSRIVVIGSGATAITLIPALEKAGADVTMLQRSPSYVAPLPEVDIISSIWKRLLPAGPAYRAARFNHAARDVAQFMVAQRAPWLFKNALRLMQRRYLPASQIDEHFTPRYNPWDQRVCKAPNGDIFTALQRNARRRHRHHRPVHHRRGPPGVGQGTATPTSSSPPPAWNIEVFRRRHAEYRRRRTAAQRPGLLPGNHAREPAELQFHRRVRERVLDATVRHGVPLHGQAVEDG
jgi:monooxygenase